MRSILAILVALWPAVAGATLVEITVPAPSVEGNLLRIDAERAVSVYTPPSYANEPDLRYPTLYVLHGFFDSNRTWTVPWNDEHPGYDTIQALMDEGIERGLLREMIVIVPDCDKASHYTDSPVRGGWESFVVHDLVDFVDAHYRTLDRPESRGITGHSMGGHGALKLAMLHPDVFRVAYGMNSSLLGWAADVSPGNPAFAGLADVQGLDQLDDAGFYVRAITYIGQSLSPNPESPLLTDPPFTLRDGAVTYDEPGHDAWSKEMPLYTFVDHLDALRRLRGFRFDSAFTDEFTHIPVTARRFSDALDEHGIEHTFEMYNGDHRNRMWGAEGRLYTVVLPYFSRLLE